MKIKQVTMRGFKSFLDETVELTGFDVLSGKNGVGKTSVIEAIRFALTGSLPKDPIKHGEASASVTIVLDDGQDTRIERTIFLPQSFQINGKDVKENVFTEQAARYHKICDVNGYKIQAFPGRSNGTFVYLSQNDLWGFLEGTFGGGRMNGIKELAVSMHDGTEFYVRKSKPSAVFVDGRKTTAKALNEMIAQRMNGDPQALALVTSSAVAEAMEDKDFANYVVSILSAKMGLDFDKLAKLTKLTKEETDILSKLFPPTPGLIQLDLVKSAYRELYAKRAEIRKTADEWNKRSTYEGPLPIVDKVKTAQRLEEVTKALGAAEELKRAHEVYNNAVLEREKALENLAGWEKTLADMASVCEPDKTLESSLKSSQDVLKEAIQSAIGESASLGRATETLRRMFENLDSKVCPLCDTLVCMTDKTACKNDLEESIRSNESAIKLAGERAEKAKAELARVEEKLAEISRQAQAYVRKETVAAQVENLKKMIPAKPVKPAAAPDVTKLEEEKLRLQERTRQTAVYEQCEKARQEYVKVKALYDLYNTLVGKCEPKKGLLTNTILDYLLAPFCKYVNGFLNQISGGMEIKFEVQEDGLEILAMVKGNAFFVPIKALSTGERMIFLVALMDMVSNISNARMLTFDCLESIDADNLDALLTLLQSPAIKGRYDHILLAMVGHPSIRQVFAKHFVNEIKM